MNGVEELKKMVHDLTEIAQKAEAGRQDMDSRVDSLIKSILSSNVGNQHRKIQFDAKSEGESLINDMKDEVAYDMDNALIVSKLLQVPIQQTKSWNKFTRKHDDFKKAMDATTGDQGGDWVPTLFSNQFFDKIHLETKEAQLFMDIQMPSNPFEIPIGIGDFETFVLAEQTADTGQTEIPVSDATAFAEKTTLTAKWHCGRIIYSKILDEDSIVALLPVLRTKITKGFAMGREDFILNGDTTAPHEDTDTTSATSRRKAYLGLRALCNDNSYTQDLATFNLSNIQNIRIGMEEYGVDPSKLVWITGIKGFFKLKNLPECITVDKLGPNATLLKGQIATFDGSPVVVSEKVRQDLTATAIYGAAGTKTILHCVYPDGFVLGTRREIMLQTLVELYAIYGQDALQAGERKAWAPLYPIASNPMVYSGINF